MYCYAAYDGNCSSPTATVSQSLRTVTAHMCVVKGLNTTDLRQYSRVQK